MIKSNPKINYVVDVLMFICFLITAISGILFLLFPEGRRSGWYQIGGFTKGELKDFHTIFGILMIIFGTIHFLLHWRWIVTMTKSFFKKGEKRFSKRNSEIVKWN